ncbi:MAG: AAA family ATPase [Candidatus Aenigmarchaeota archaeon]|nr:AAA family ATPase [Candidatus Aenigmarchaeota archaeon]
MNKMEREDEIGKYREWLKKHELQRTPFTLEIIPSLRVGYKNQVATLLRNIEQRQKLLLLMGPTGSGKTTLINHLCDSQKNYIFVGKPPRKTEELIKLADYFHKDVPFITRLFLKKPKEVHHISDYLNKITNEHKVIFIDEAHEASIEVLEWLRVISDQTQNITFVLSGLPIFDDILTKNLETLKKRVSEKIELSALSRDETEELIRKRIEYAGGKEIRPFTPKSIDFIYQRTGGFPRDVLTLCNHMFNLAAEKNADEINENLLGESKSGKIIGNYDANKLKDLPEKQKKIIDLLLEEEPQTPTDLAKKINDYPSEKHALRAVNNLLKRMLEEGYIERSKNGKAYAYLLGPQTRTKLVKA